MPENNQKSIRGIKAQNFNAVLMITGCLLTLFIFYTSYTIKNKYDEIVFSMNDYTECSKAVYELLEASEYLTNQSRLFSQYHDVAYLQNYFFEINELKRRYIAVELVEMTHLGDTPDVNIKSALFESEMLEKTETYAIKLICEALHMEEDDIPLYVKKMTLQDADKLLIDEAKLAKANEMLFSREYYNSKDRISFYCNCTLTSLIQTNIAEQKNNDKDIKNIFHQQILFIVFLFLTSIVLYIFLLRLVLIPLFNNLVCIKKGTKMKYVGAYEVKYIASAYNALCDKNAVTASVLKHEAEHDSLTGLINRKAFDKIKKALSDSGESIAFMIIDIDLFKQINDKYGHLIGDEVLKKISNLLMEQFRATDYVARIGGDEFAVIMTKFGMHPTEIIQRKISELNTRLQIVEDGMPPVSLSVGVAFSENGYIPSIEEYADKALYNVKRGGRCNCSFYGENNIKD